MPKRLSRLRIPPVSALLALLVIGGSVVSACQSASTEVVAPPSDPFEGAAEAIRGLLTADSTGFTLANGKRILLHPSVASFYATQNYAPAWTDSTARDTVISRLRSSSDDGLDPDRYNASLLNTTGEGEFADSTLSVVDLDLLLTNAVFTLADDLSGPRVDVRELYGSEWFPTRRAVPPDTMLAFTLAERNPAAAVASYIESMHPQDPAYRALRAMVTHQRSLVERDDWPVILAGRQIGPGDTSVVVPTLRERLWLEDPSYSQPAESDPLVYDSTLSAAVRTFQAAHNLEADGVVDRATRFALNSRPTGDIIPLLVLNLERWRWLPEDLGDFHVLVNIPAFDLAVRERLGDSYTEPLRMTTVVGKRTWETPVFSDTMTQIIFNPTWSIPASIQMESYGRVEPGGMVRRPGPGNPMGRVKFRFPNRHAIYIHDTTSRWAFSHNQRAYSHGCIRAHEPQRLAEEILTRTNGWSKEDVDAEFTGAWRTQNVVLDRPVPVHIVYLTAWVGADGRLATYPDIYGYDARLAEALGIDLGPRS